LNRFTVILLAGVEDVRTSVGKFVNNIAEMADTEGVNILKTYLPPSIKPLFDLGVDDLDEAA